MRCWALVEALCLCPELRPIPSPALVSSQVVHTSLQARQEGEGTRGDPSHHPVHS